MITIRGDILEKDHISAMSLFQNVMKNLEKSSVITQTFPEYRSKHRKPMY